MSEEAVRADNQQFHKLALERYLPVVRDLSDILVDISHEERLSRIPFARPRRRRLNPHLAPQRSSAATDSLMLALPSAAPRSAAPSVSAAPPSALASAGTAPSPLHFSGHGSGPSSSGSGASYFAANPPAVAAQIQAPASSAPHCAAPVSAGSAAFPSLHLAALDLDPSNPRISVDDKHAIMNIRDQYVARVNVLIANLPPEVTYIYTHPPRQTAPQLRLPHAQPHARTTGFEASFLNIMRHDLSRLPVPSPFSFDPLIRPLQIMQRLAKSMTHGEFITPQLYIPADVWCQPGARIAFLDLKCSVFGQLFVPLGRLKSYQQDDPDVTSIRSFNRAIEDYESATDAARIQLVKRLKFLAADDDAKLGGAFGDVLGGPSAPDPAQAIATPTTGRDRFIMNWSVKLQKSFEKFTGKEGRGAAARHDVSSGLAGGSGGGSPSGQGAGGPSAAAAGGGSGASAKMQTLISYRDIMTRFLIESCLVFAYWVDKVTTRSGGSDDDLASDDLPSLPGRGAPSQLVQTPEARHVRNKLKKLLTFYDSVVCVMLARDLHELVDRFTRKIRKVSNI
ncbi:hypothetical protein HK105_207611 [Polyrhizophydium stewartii]|uniref:Uncharacterized protein n=1 Tax=Polyrhizophydium stewartii TaxID=2732419 RepID=A0ABR4N0B9_9FUNG